MATWRLGVSPVGCARWPSQWVARDVGWAKTLNANHCVKRLGPFFMIQGMQTESHPGPLPLADALIAWSDPAFIEAIRRETAKLDPDVLTRMDRYTLDSIRVERRKPQRGRILSLVPTGLSAFDRAWDRLFNHFRLKVEQGLVELQGVDTLSIGRLERERIPSARASEMTFDPAGGAVFVGIRIYTNVIVSWRNDVSVWGDEPRTPEPIPEADERVVASPAPPTNAEKTLRDKSPAGRGRESFTPLIREALDDRWDAVHQGVREGTLWTTMASWLRKHLERKYPDRILEKRIPVIGTIRTRLPRIYKEECVRRSVR
jgi:hypothetical protein